MTGNHKDQALHVGIVGFGRIGKHRLNGLLSIPDVKVVAIAEPQEIHDEDGLLRKAGNPKVYKNQDALIEDPDVQTVMICSSSGQHCDAIVACVKCAKPFFCEKPLTVDLDEAKHLVAVMETSNGLYGQIGFNRRYDEGMQRMKHAVNSGEIGSVRMVHFVSADAAVQDLNYLRTSGGIHIDMLVHEFDSIRFVTGDEVTEVYASGEVLIDPEIKTFNDVDCTMMPNSCVLTSASACLRDNQITSNWTRYEKSYDRETADFIRRIKKHDPSPCSVLDGARAVAISHAARQSLHQNKPIKVPDVQ